jgi:selenocysteine lyase/cysteine desulfurase
MLSNRQKFFSLPKSITYLNGAYMSPLLKSVEKVGVEALMKKRNPTQISQKDFFTDSDKLRKAFGTLVNCKESNRIAIIPSVSYGMANVVKNISMDRTQHVLVAAEQFPSNFYPWQRLCEEKGAEVKIVAPPQSREHRGKIWNERILENITGQTKVVALGHVHWADGTLFNLLAIRKRTKEVGALLIIDGTQSVGALPFDVEKIQPDALICGGYKWLLGPYSMGLAYYGEYFDGGRPVEENWINRKNSEDFSGLVNYEPNYQAGALRYEVGEHSNFILVPMLLNALEQLNKWKPENIQAYCHSITRNAIRELGELGFWIEDEAYRASHLFGVRLPVGLELQKIKEDLLKKRIFVSFRGDSIRISPNVYNTKEELKKLTAAFIQHL